MKDKTILIQIDIDSTLYDADPLFSRIAKEKGIQWIDRSPYWFSNKEIGASLQDVKNVFRIAHSKEYVLSNEPYSGAAETIEKWVEEIPDVKIAYVSDRNSQQSSALSIWLEEHGFFNIGETQIVLSKDKREWMRQNLPKIVIDDRIRTMLFANSIGAEVFSIEHPHNVNLKGESDHITIVKTWEEMYEPVRTACWDKIFKGVG